MVTSAIIPSKQIATPAILIPPGNPMIINQTSPVTPNDQFSIALPDGTKKFMVKCRTPAILLLSYDVGFSTYVTIPSNTVYPVENVLLYGINIQLKCSGISTVIEVVTWS